MGDSEAQFLVYIDKHPPFPTWLLDKKVQALSSGDIHVIGQACGNGWRKVFNLYAKLVFALKDTRLPVAPPHKTWQQYREQTLLQAGSNTGLMFSAPSLLPEPNSAKLHIVMGRGYAKSLSLPVGLTWLDHEFAVAPAQGLIVCPYFDYRQLSNIKLIRLVQLLGHIPSSSPVN